MAKRRKNTVDFVEEVFTPEERIITFVDARVQFLRDIRGLAKQTQRWHKENLSALEKVLDARDRGGGLPKAYGFVPEGA
ncbi:MAG: hypothetical protein OWQ59_02215, partial [Alicyclobacillaceae bacterium]|nr:hypothetical protein [Alicyclobacillaceae bacterium]